MKLLYKYKQIKRSYDGIVKMLMPSLIGIGVCITCLLGTTFAWFTDNTSTGTQTIQSSTYDLTIVVMDGDTEVVPVEGIYTLSQKQKNEGYTVSITAEGTAIKGYCKINDEATYEINTGKTVELTLYPEEKDKQYTFTTIWGTYLGNITDSPTLGTPLESNNSETSDIEGIENNTSKPEDTESSKPSKVEEDKDAIKDSIESTEQNTSESEEKDDSTSSEVEKDKDSTEGNIDNIEQNTSESEEKEGITSSEEEEDKKDTTSSKGKIE